MSSLKNGTEALAAETDPVVEARLAECAVEGAPAIESRLNQLHREWTSTRVLEAAISVVALVGVGLAWYGNTWGLWLPAVASVLLLQNALSSFGILNAITRAVGLKSELEHEQERAMLKVIRGDFVKIPAVVDEEDRIAIARLEEEGGVVDGPEIRVPVNHEAIREVIHTVRRDAPSEN